jgi:hypothetical protein
MHACEICSGDIMIKSMRWLCLAMSLVSMPVASAFNGHQVKQGPLSLTIDDIEQAKVFDRPMDVSVTVAHAGQAAMEVRLQMDGLVTPWYAVGPDTLMIRLLPGEPRRVKFKAAVAKGAYAALYPVHVTAAFVYNGKASTAHAVQIIETQLPIVTSGRSIARTIDLPAQGAVDLTRVTTQQVVWQYFGQAKHTMPVGWTGSADPSRANFAVRQVMRGTTKNSLEMHPAWSGGAGTIFAKYQIQLPPAQPIHLSFANAIRDHRTDEPASDGVSFRVWINGRRVYEHFTDSKVWVQGQVDLSEYASQKITLMLESHPGPSRDTTCDASYWARPVITSGTRRAPTPLSGKRKQRDLALTSLASPGSPGTGACVFSLDSGL